MTFVLIRKFDVKLQPLHIAGDLNILADQLSHTLEYNWSKLHPSGLDKSKLVLTMIFLVHF